jgi:hypothetical protein
LTARTDAAAEATAAETTAAAEAAAAAGGTAKAAADAPGARAALASELPKEPGGGGDGMAENAEEIPGRPVFNAGSREELKVRGGSLSSEGENAAVQAERSTPIKVLRSLEYSNALVLNTIITSNLIIGVHLHGIRYTRIEQFPNHYQ